MIRSFSCHSREGGNPVILRTSLGSRLRGNDEQIAALDAESAKVLGNIKALLNNEKTHG